MNNDRNNWESDLQILNSVEVIVPVKLLIVCNHICNRVRDNEFSIVTRIKEKELGKITLDEEYYIPKQEITSGSIDYKPDKYDHEVVIHRHPDRLNEFSKTDREFINQNFELSLLFTRCDGFVNGIYNLKYEEAIIPLPVEIFIDYGIGVIDTSNLNVSEEFELMKESKRTKRGSNNKDGDKDIFDMNDELSEMKERINMIEEEMFNLTGPYLQNF